MEMWSYRCCKVMALASLDLAIQDQNNSQLNAYHFTASYCYRVMPLLVLKS